MIYESPVLYKTGNRGLEEWSCWVEEKHNRSEIYVQWGLSGGAVQNKCTVITKGKNIGKINATTHSEQAVAEAKSKVEKQLDKGYFKDKSQAQRGIRCLPMLAKVYDDHKDKVKFPCYIQPKLDGMRALSVGSDLYSRKGKPIDTVSHIQFEIVKLFGYKTQLVLDGELYVHGNNFQELISAAKRKTANANSEELEYHIYDSFLMDEVYRDERSFSERTKILQGIQGNKVKIVKTYTCNSEQDIYDFHAQFLKAGYEGSIVRLNDYPYEVDRRSFSLLKLKNFQDAEFQIIGFKEDKNNHAVFNCITQDGKEFDVKPQGTDEQRKQYLVDAPNLIGKDMTVKYFGFTDDGKPRFPVGLRMYDEI